MAQVQFEIQRNWLLNPLPPSREVCPVCRGVRDPRYPLCFSCSEAQRRARGVLANAVVPISYSPDNGQHYHQLKVYKSPTSPNRLALFRLAVLYTMFANTHQRCLERIVGGPFTHVTNVPSTRARAATHPLQAILAAAHPSLPRIDGRVNADCGNVREFFADRFHVPAFAAHGAPKVLLLEDLWVTGARAQSMAHALRAAGAAVVIVALGRQLNHGYQPVQPLLDAARQTSFDLSRCALDDLSG